MLSDLIAYAPLAAPEGFIPWVDVGRTAGAIQVNLPCDVDGTSGQPHHWRAGGIGLKAHLRASGDVNRGVVPDAVRPGARVNHRRCLCLCRGRPDRAVPEPGIIVRSEERRVGKECRL